MALLFRNTVFAVAAAVAMTAAIPAHATVSISCSGVDNDTVSVDIGFGTLPVLSVISAYVTADGERFSLRPQEGETEIINGEAAFLNDGLVARFTDPNISQILVDIRILSKSEAKSDASVGLLTLPGKSVYGLTCFGP